MANNSERRLLITGFGPYASVAVNPTASIAEELAAKSPSRRHVILPTSYQRADEILRDELESGEIDGILMLGHTTNATGPRIEQFGRNADRSTQADVDNQAGHHVISTDQLVKLPTTIDIAALAEVLHGRGFRYSVSTDAGGYVCNHAYFTALSSIRSGEREIPCIFVHLPTPRNKAEATRTLNALDVVADFVSASSSNGSSRNLTTGMPHHRPVSDS